MLMLARPQGFVGDYCVTLQNQYIVSKLIELMMLTLVQNLQ